MWIKENYVMFLYTVIEAIVGVVGGILLAACTKRSDGLLYGKLDKAGRITNILLIPVYALLSPFCLFLGMIARPDHDGFLGFLGWVVAIIMASATLFCGLGLGFSVALRKKGKSKLGFAFQFAGALGIGLTVILFFVFYGNLLKPLN